MTGLDERFLASTPAVSASPAATTPPANCTLLDTGRYHDDGARAQRSSNLASTHRSQQGAGYLSNYHRRCFDAASLPRARPPQHRRRCSTRCRHSPAAPDWASKQRACRRHKLVRACPTYSNITNTSPKAHTPTAGLAPSQCAAGVGSFFLDAPRQSAARWYVRIADHPALPECLSTAWR